MCQPTNSASAKFKMNRKIVKKLNYLLPHIRMYRDASPSVKKSCAASYSQMVRIAIIKAIGLDYLPLAKLIYKRATKAGLVL